LISARRHAVSLWTAPGTSNQHYRFAITVPWMIKNSRLVKKDMPIPPNSDKIELFDQHKQYQQNVFRKEN